ncbi:MAG TPA: YdcF family protein [Bryobacteraceae bacterium]|nr:YdcF family protein [Bryobacteraceae bacterium]
MASFDAVVIPAGGLEPDGSLPPWVVPRLDRALALASATRYVITLSAGTFHKPLVRNASNAPVFESAAAARYLIDRGFPGERLLTETSSYDTVGNAYFCRVIHADPQRLSRLLIVTSAFHMPRTEAVFRWVFNLVPLAFAYELAFEATPDAGLDKRLLAARNEKERTALAALLPKTNRYRTLAEFHRWLYTEHRIYAPRPWNTPRVPPPPDVLSTY